MNSKWSGCLHSRLSGQELGLEKVSSATSTLRIGVAEVVRLQKNRTLTSSATPKSSIDGALGVSATPNEKESSGRLPAPGV